MKQLTNRIRREVRPFQRVVATLAAAVVAPLVPSRLDPVLTAGVTRCFLAVLPQRRRFVASQMAEQLGTATEADLLAAADRYWVDRVETRWGMARGISITGWSPTVELVGSEHVRTSLAAGRGVILWRVSSHSAIPLNLALARAGLAPVHLSRPDHLMMVRDNRFWNALRPRVAPILRRGEEAHMAERVELGARGTTAAMKRLIAVLRANEVVTIVGDLATGRKTHTVAINDKRVELANGGAKLAVRTGAALHPVTVNRAGPLRYRVIVEEALVPVDGSTNEAVDSLIEQFAEVLAAWIREDPAAWPKWRDVSS